MQNISDNLQRRERMLNKFVYGGERGQERKKSPEDIGRKIPPTF